MDKKTSLPKPYLTMQFHYILISIYYCIFSEFFHKNVKKLRFLTELSAHGKIFAVYFNNEIITHFYQNDRENLIFIPWVCLYKCQSGRLFSYIMHALFHPAARFLQKLLLNTKLNSALSMKEFDLVPSHFFPSLHFNIIQSIYPAVSPTNHNLIST